MVVARGGENDDGDEVDQGGSTVAAAVEQAVQWLRVVGCTEILDAKDDWRLRETNVGRRDEEWNADEYDSVCKAEDPRTANRLLEFGSVSCRF